MTRKYILSYIMAFQVLLVWKISLHLLLLIFLQILSGKATENERFDCYPDGSANENSCKERNCIWKKSSSKGIPYCFYNSSAKYGYKASHGYSKLGLTANLSRYKNQLTDGIFKNAVENARLDVEFQTSSRLRIVFRDVSKERYEVPVQKAFPKTTSKASNIVYGVNCTEDPFSVQIFRKDTGRIIWDTSVGAFIFADQFLQLSTRLPSEYIYGFGEHEHSSFKHDLNWKTFGMFSRDQWPTPDQNLYGVHPFYMCVENDGKAHGILLLNSNAMEVTLQPTPALTYRTIGGILDFYFFFGPSPEKVVQQYTELIGRPVMPPYWALGFQLCRYGYNHINVVKNTVARMKKYDIPQDVQYGDIDYMDRQLDFTYSKTRYKGLPDFVRQIKKDGIRYITILDPAIGANETGKTYRPFDLGKSLDIFIKMPGSNQTIFGKVWPDYPNITVDVTKGWNYQVENYRSYAAFPDFFHPKINQWWGTLIKEFHDTILEFDGLWIDMNEPANFVEGSVNGCPNNSYENPPYKPKTVGDRLADKTLCMSAKHFDGAIEYNYHSLFGWSQTEPTLLAAQEATGKRSVVISRSTYPSSGRYAGHWLGDNTSIWPHLHKSIIGMLEFNLFGIPYIGADICGFIGNTTAPLCERWMQLGAFYPFSRNHNGLGYNEQDPAVFGDSFAKMSRDILRTRYTLLPYLYTLFYEAHTKGSTVVRPIMHEFVNDKKTWTIDRQFLWGPALLITPVLDEHATSVEGYLPHARWYDYYTGQLENCSAGANCTWQTPKTKINLHVRGGYVLPTQDPANNTMHSRRNSMGLLAALDDNKQAQGSLFWDDGDQKNPSAGNHLLLKFKANKDSVNITIETNSYNDASKFHIGNITIFGIPADRDDNVMFKVNNQPKSEKQTAKVTGKGVLKITGLKLLLSKSHQISWSFTKNPHRPSSATHLTAKVFLILFSLFSVVFGTL